jgi:hypothetical protein
MYESKRKFEQLELGAQKEVEGFRASIFYRWPTPNVPAEGKLDWDDDLAVLYLDYGHRILDEAISFHRQNTEKRPSMAAIRERCVMARQKSAAGHSKSDQEYARHERDVREHIANPANRDFIPFAMLMRDAITFQAIKAKAIAQGNFRREDAEQWWDWRNAETEKEWSEMRARGVKSVVFRPPGWKADLSKRGSSEMQGVGEIATQTNLRLDS